MNTNDLFFDNKRLLQVTQKVLLDILKTKQSSGIEAQNPQFYEHHTPVKITNLGLFRISNIKYSLMVPIGSSQEGFHDKFYNLMGATTDDEKKVMENDLLKALHQVIDMEFKANQIILDSKAIIFMNRKNLGKWDVFEVKTFMRFAFTTPQGPLHFEVPLFDNDYLAKKMVEFYGFPENSHIMVVDDSATARKIPKQYLAMAGYFNVEESVDGKSALSRLKSSVPPFDLVISDWHMPNLTGLELLKKIRSEPSLKNLPVILATGERNKEEVEMAIKEKASSYLVKPFDTDAFYNSIRKASVYAKQFAKK